MAIVFTQIETTLTRTVFVKPPDAYRQFTAIPRALVNFTAITTIPLKPVNDQQELAVRVTLDPEFAYRIVDFNMHITQDVANSWNPRGYMEVFNGIRNLPAGSVERHPFILEFALRINAPVEMWMARWLAAGDPNYIIQAAPVGSLAQISFETTNQSAPAAAAGTFGCMITFFEFDIEQAEFFAVHTPQLVYDR